MPGQFPLRNAAYYAALYSSIGIWMPYMSAHFRELGFSGKQVAAVAAVSPLSTLIMPLLWGFFADRTGRPKALLVLCTTMSAAGLAALSQATTFTAAVGFAFVTALFSTSLGSLSDTLASAAVRGTPFDFAKVRVWGSVGFAVSAYAYGEAREGTGVPSPPLVAAVSMAFAAAIAASLEGPRQEAAQARPGLADAAGLLRSRALLLFLAAALVHWASFSPYHLFLAIHLDGVPGGKRWVGVAFALAVAAEIVVMFAYRRFFSGRAPLRLIAACIAVGAVRWGLSAWVSSASAVALLQVLHGLSFGLFYVAAMAHLDRILPPMLQATGRALFASASWGLGGVVGHALSGAVFDAAGGRAALASAALLEVGALATVALATRRASEKTAHHDG